MKRKKGWMRSVKAVCAAAMAISLALGNVSPALAAGQDAKPAVTEKAGREALPGNGMMLDSSWIVDNPSEGKLKVNEDGSVTITTEGGEWGGMKNVLRQKVANKADFVLTVKVRGLVEKDFQGAYLMASSGPGQANAVAAVRRYHSFLGGGYGANELVGMMSNGGSTAEFYTAEQGREDEVYLRLKKSGSSFSSYYSKSYSATDEGWTLIQDGKNSSINAITQGNLAGTEEIYIGFTANSGGQNNGMDITFSDFRFDGEEIPLGVNLSSLSSVELTCSDKIAAGGTASLTMKALDGNGDEIAKEELTSVVYSSDDEEIATVDQKGVVTGVKAGKTVIRCEVTAGNIVRTASLEVQVGEIVVEKSWTTTSPDGKTVLEVELMTGGALQYRAKQDGKVTMETSPIGIVTNLGDFSKKLAYKSETSEEEINETYPMISGKKKIYTNHCKQRTVTFTLEGKPGVEFDFITRAYDDGTAFRYAIRGQENEALSISSETTAFQLPAEAEVYYMPHGSGQWTYEGYYEKATAETLEEGAIPSIPLLYKTKDGVWNLLTEAALNGSYTGSMTRVEKGGLLRLAFDPIQSKDVQTTAPFLSPWRTIITGTPEDIVQNTMTENLSPERLEGYDFENWVDPGLSSWSWVTYYGGQENEETHKKFIDLAADLGWKYYILDEGWQPQTTNGDGTRYTGYREWFYRVRDYANEKGVKLIAWVDSKDISQKEHRESRLDQWAKDGIVGIKTDFFNHESQSVLQVYDELYKYCAQKHLMVNIHGGNKATGEVRTYPNVLAREGIAGQEQGGITAEQYTLIPFIRAAVGPADVTEQLFSRDVNKTTMGFQIALTALVEDGIHSMGDSVENYYKVAPAISYYKNYPSSWDDLKYLDSVPGDYVNLARKAGDSWYVSGISTKEKNMEIVLDFLESGTDYTAVIYKENGRSDLVMEVQEAASTDTLSIPVLKGGGYAVKLIPKEQLDVVTSITTDKTEITLEKNRTYQAKATPFPADAQYQEVVWSSANEEIAKVNSSGLITGLADGETTITVSSAFDANVKAEIKVKVIPERYALDTERWEIISENEKRFLNSETSVSIVTENGGIGGKNLFAMKVPEGKKDFTLTAKVSGGLSANYQGAFIAVFDKDDIGNNYVSAGRRYHNYLFPNSPKRFGMMSGGGSIGEFYGEDGNPDAEAYIKLVKEGNKFTGYYSFDNEEWTQIVQNESGKNAESVTSDKLANCENLYVGFYASSGGANNELVITFEDFTFDGQVIPVAVDTRPEEPELPATPESVAELADAVAQVENKYQETDYTEEDWKTFTDALKEAKQVIGNEEATQKQVDDAKKKLDAAVNLLESKKPVPEPDEPASSESVAELTNAVSEVENKYKETDYTQEDWKTFTDALKEAKQVLGNEEATQKQVDDAKKKLDAAVNLLESKKPVPEPDEPASSESVTELTNAVSEVENKYKETDYTEEDWKTFTDALKEAKQVLGNEEATQKQVDDAKKKLDAAVNLLESKKPVPEPDEPASSESVTELTNAVSEVENKYKETDYTEEDWKTFTDALKEAKQVLGNEEATQKQVDDAKKKLDAAVNLLESKKPVPEPDEPASSESVTELTNAVSEVENKYKETDYTEEDWKTFTDALKEAKQVLGNEEATQKQVDDAKKKLDAAVSLLESKKPVPEPDEPANSESVTELTNTILGAENKYKQSDYTPAAWLQFTDALKEAKQVIGNEKATQKQVDEAKKKLQDAIGRLETENQNKPVQADKTQLANRISSAENTYKNAAEYLASSWNVYANALAQAKIVLNDGNVTQAQVDAADNNLQNAILSLVKLKVVSTKKVTLGVKETYSVKVKNATYTASNKNVATVTGSGKVTAKKTGKVNVRVIKSNGDVVQYVITIKKAPKKISKVTPAKKTLKKGKTCKLKVTLPKGTASNKITFASSNKRVATVTAKGVVKAKKKGKAVITVKTFNKKTKKVRITVK